MWPGMPSLRLRITLKNWRSTDELRGHMVAAAGIEPTPPINCPSTRYLYPLRLKLVEQYTTPMNSVLSEAKAYA
jgi:hypothetical protein